MWSTTGFDFVNYGALKGQAKLILFNLMNSYNIELNKYDDSTQN